MFRTIINEIQDLIERIESQGFVNLDVWVDSLNGELGAILLRRLVGLLRSWVSTGSLEKFQPQVVFPLVFDDMLTSLL